MNKIIVLVLFIWVNFTAHTQTRVSGIIEGLSTKVDILYLTLGEAGRMKTIATSMVHNDSFEFLVPDPEPKIYTVVSWKDFKTEPRGFIFWVDANHITISGSVNDIVLNKNRNRPEAYMYNLYAHLKKKGSVNQELMEDFIRSNEEDLSLYFQLEDKVFLKKGKSPRMIIREKILSRTEPFILKNNDKPCSAFILFWLGPIEKVIDKKETRRLLSLLTGENKRSYYAKLAYDLLEKS